MKRKIYKFCEVCGEKLIAIKAGGFDPITGKPKFNFKCATLKCGHTSIVDGNLFTIAHKYTPVSKPNFFNKSGIKICSKCGDSYEYYKVGCSYL